METNVTQADREAAEAYAERELGPFEEGDTITQFARKVVAHHYLSGLLAERARTQGLVEAAERGTLMCRTCPAQLIARAALASYNNETKPNHKGE